MTNDYNEDFNRELEYNRELEFVEALEASVEQLEIEVKELKLAIAIDPDVAASRVAMEILANTGTQPLNLLEDNNLMTNVKADRQSIINKHIENWKQQNISKANRQSKG